MISFSQLIEKTIYEKQEGDDVTVFVNSHQTADLYAYISALFSDNLPNENFDKYTFTHEKCNKHVRVLRGRVKINPKGFNVVAGALKANDVVQNAIQNEGV